MKQWTCAVHFLSGKHWTATIAVTVEGGSLSAISARAVRAAKEKAGTILVGKRLYGVTVKVERVRPDRRSKHKNEATIAGHEHCSGCVNCGRGLSNR